MRLIWAITGDNQEIYHALPAPVADDAPSLMDAVRRRRSRTKLKVALGALSLPLLAFGGWRTYEFSLGCRVMPDDPIVMHPDRNRSHYIRKGSPDRVLVFVHGIFGDAGGTWTAPPDTYWPELIAGDDTFQGTDIYVASYETGLANRMRIDEIEDNLFLVLSDDDVFSGHREVVFLCHSLGGLVIERLLLRHSAVARQVPVVYFYSTPQTGSEVAKLGSVFSADPLLRDMLPGDRNSYLRAIETDWKGAGFSIKRLCAYEKLKYKCQLVVDELSGTRNCDVQIAINKNHATIVKPASTRDMAHVFLRNTWRQYLH